MNKSSIIVLENAQAVHVRAAEEIAHIAGEAICMHGEFNLCLTGGQTPAGAYELLATRFLLSVDWKEVRFFWGDERCVPPDDAASNYGMANRTMLSKLTLHPSQVHRIHGEQPPEEGARNYEADLRDSFSLGEGEIPRFDLILLGLGENAHIASLFPQNTAIHESERLAVAVEVDAAQRHRVSLTASVLNHAAHVIFIVSGEAKAQAVYDVLEGPREPDRFPGQIIAPSDGEVLWLVDRDAAGKLCGSAG
ncbi:MAG: 6-phosphogluconolactonase [Candidatus Binataceae bacterium]